MSLRAMYLDSFLTQMTAKLAKTAADPTQAPEDSTGPLPQTLVRIPTEHAPALQAQAEAAEAAAEEEES